MGISPIITVYITHLHFLICVKIIFDNAKILFLQNNAILIGIFFIMSVAISISCFFFCAKPCPYPSPL